MKIEKNNIKVEVNKPEINFDEFEFEQAEKEKLKKQRTKIIIAGVLSACGAAAVQIAKAKKKYKKK